MSATVTDDPVVDPAPDDAIDKDKPQRPRSLLLRALAAMVVVGAALAALIVLVANQSGDASTPDPFEVVVAPDTGPEIATGDADDLVPAIIRLQPGQDLVLVNNDWRPHTLGQLTAERGQTARQTFPTEGRYITSTSLRFDGRVTILVEDTSS